VLFWTLAAALAANQFDTLRSLGTTLLASAGVLSLVVGMAARSTFANLVAGVQLAFTQPIRVGDMVTLRDETGEVEDITLTYTFIRTGDGRRLAFPNEVLSNEVIKNFTLRSMRSQANAVFFVGYGAELPALRKLLVDAAKACPAWEGAAEPLSPPPELGLDGLTETAMRIKLTAWSVTPQLAAVLSGQLREAGLVALQKAKVPLPQSRVATLPAEQPPLPEAPAQGHPGAASA
jgi:small-conductance mechanosensitive channel